ncbi:Erg29p ASCRUDRAFT_73880 [Ascoidea rubescens DSM 1968]|uniref:Uncharacterized protein n=1 Tax=Ascoidea rubescens DSM 1968 TaxID=1344418 RepID=A0A1D2VRG3_9ASCO|nr:hypothetical protein ASCRUDRAFT_73880 [Ascoidea rubescens DSM 1968]ODV64203.1 hypothetical protein ASCRUDRAFT_73880 [Ascoidea rubescens DSM 1968]
MKELMNYFQLPSSDLFLANYSNYYSKLDNLLTDNVVFKKTILKYHMETSTGKFITILSIILLFSIIFYHIILEIGVLLKIWSHPTADVFVYKPVHCAHVYINLNFIKRKSLIDHKIDFGNISNEKNLNKLYNVFYKDKSSSSLKLLKKPLKYHIEFAPDDYNEKDPELGTTLKFLRNKIMQLFYESKFYNNDEFSNNIGPKKLKIDLKDIKIFHKKEEVPIEKDNEPLCLVDINTGNTADAIILI